jgi:hypothetical protein
VEARDGIEPSNKALQTLPSGFGFRANSDNVEMVTKMNQGVTAGPGSHQFARVVPGAILLVPLHKVPPPKESMKEFVENRA